LSTVHTEETTIHVPGTTHHDYWNSFYSSSAEKLVPENPSPFAQWAVEQFDPAQTVVEFGFGTARDSLWFAARGHAVRGFDFAEAAVDRARARAKLANFGDAVSFSLLDLSDQEQLRAAAAELRLIQEVPVVYGRFLLHSLEDQARMNLFALMSDALAGCDFMFEFRTGLDAGAEHVFGDEHFRQYLQPEKVQEEIEQRGGVVTLSVSGHGFAVHKSEDPHVCRMAGTWARSGS
jgi:SAM-dependent methyltransferase